MDWSRKVMITSVTVLGLSLVAFMLTYMVLGDDTDEDLRSLAQTNIIFRHGAKIPDRAYVADSEDNAYHIEDIGALSPAGSLQMYNLGKNLRHRYIKLLPANGFYSRKLVEVRTSWMERTISSALSFLAAFMPPLKNNPLPISWQPVPVNPIPRDRDDLIAQKKSCPKYDEVFAKVLKWDEITALDEANKNLYRLLARHSGANVSTLSDVETLHNHLEASDASGKLPDWAENLYPEKTKPLAERYLRLISETPFMKRIKGGPLYTEIVQTMINRRNKISERTITIYSGHDVTLVTLMNALQILNETTASPGYSSALCIELHNSSTYGDMEVKIYFYFSSDDKYPKKVRIPGCDEPCTLNQFRKIMNGIFVNDFERLCETA